MADSPTSREPQSFFTFCARLFPLDCFVPLTSTLSPVLSELQLIPENVVELLVSTPCDPSEKLIEGHEPLRPEIAPLASASWSWLSPPLPPWLSPLSVPLSFPWSSGAELSFTWIRLA